MAYQLNQIVIHENRRCKIVELTESTAKLVNLEYKGGSDWKMMEITISNIEEDNTNEQ
jgi:hypothetical protein